jgi:hypothetical protein
MRLLYFLILFRRMHTVLHIVIPVLTKEPVFLASLGITCLEVHAITAILLVQLAIAMETALLVLAGITYLEVHVIRPAILLVQPAIAMETALLA